MYRHSVYFNLNMLISLPCYISDFSVKWYLMQLPNCNFFRSLVQFVFLESWKRKRLEAMSKQNIILSLNPCKSHVYTYLRLCACKFSKGLQQSDQAIVWLRNCRVHEILHKAEFINAGTLLHSYPGQLTVSQQWWSHVSQLCTNTYTNIPSLFFSPRSCALNLFHVPIKIPHGLCREIYVLVPSSHLHPVEFIASVSLQPIRAAQHLTQV